MEFFVLAGRPIEDEMLKRDVWELMDAKKKGTKLDRGPRIPTISEFLDNHLARLSVASHETSETKSPEVLDKFLVKALVELNRPIIGQSDGE
ncbi:MAG: nucleotidyltransferase domain-containing protein [Thermodesulfobacteriota bacterium]|nr:nucleotidyltransferase domain-containing protein [Thermodesulfobacteriota bacterium]